MTADQLGKVVATMQEKANRPCEACGESDWRVAPHFVLIQGQSKPSAPYRPETLLPSIITICGNCGNTQFFNVHPLGLAKLLGFPPPGGKLPWGDDRSIVVHQVTDSELESVASGTASIHMAFLGFTLGAFVALFTTIYTVDISNPNYHAAFIALTWLSALLTIYFAVRSFLSSHQMHKLLMRLKNQVATPR
jgi:hypothetical protein